MTPYLVHKTWVDLDHVLAIGSEVRSEHYDTPVGGYSWWTIDVVMMFRDRTLTIGLGKVSDVHLAGLGDPAPNMILADFIAAWKGRGRTVGRPASNPP